MEAKYKWVYGCGTVIICILAICITVLVSSQGSYDINLNANKEFETAMTNLDMKPIHIENSSVIIYCSNENESIQLKSKRSD